MKCSKLCLIVVVLFMCSGQASAVGNDMIICSITGDPGDRQIGTIQPEISFDSNYFTKLRAKLTSPTNFGQDGVVQKLFYFTDMFENESSIYVEILDAAQCDIFVLTGEGFFMLGLDEYDALYDWVSDGGVLLHLENDIYNVAFNQLINVETNVINSPGNWAASEFNFDHPVFDGPFGLVEEVESGLSDDFMKYYVAPDEDAILALDTTFFEAMMLEIQLGSGYVYLIADHRIFGHNSISPGPLQLTDQDTFALNFFAELAATVNRNNLVIDAPVITSPPEASTWPFANVTVSGNGLPTGAMVNVSVVGLPHINCAAQITVNQWECELNNQLPDGSYELVAYAEYDNVTSPLSAVVSFEIDAAPPAPPVITQPEDWQEFTGNPTVRGTSETGNIIQITFLESPGVGCSDVTDGDGNWACIPTPDLADGVYTLNAVAERAGEFSVPSQITIVIDSNPVGTVPEPPVFIEPLDFQALQGGIPLALGTAESGVTVFVAVLESPGDGCSDLADVSGNWGCVPAPVLADGTYTLRAVAELDGALSDPTEITVIIDSVAPEAPVVIYPAEGQVIDDNTPLMIGSAEPGVSVVLSGSEGGSCETTADLAGAWSCQYPFVENGAYELTAFAVDGAGNQSTDSVRSYSVDGNGLPEHDFDLSVTISNCINGIRPEETFRYVVEIENIGLEDITDATVTTNLSELIGSVSWACLSDEVGGNSQCGETSGTSDIIDLISINSNASITYLVDTSVNGLIDQIMTSSVMVSLPVGVVDGNLENNVAVDEDLIYQYLFKSGFDCAITAD